MTVGAILREALFSSAEKVLVKANEDIELGEIICNDGSGFVAATQALIRAGAKAYMAMEDHDYSAVSYHYIGAVAMGKVTVQKISGSGAIKQGQKVAISTTAGEVTKFVKGDLPAGGVSTYYTTTIEANAQTAIDTNLEVVGTCAKDAGDTDTEIDIWLGVY